MRKSRVEGRYSLYWGLVYRWWVWHPDGGLHGNYRTWKGAMAEALRLAAEMKLPC
jgi:hypothetical protein